jgi:hypothetical protein
VSGDENDENDDVEGPIEVTPVLITPDEILAVRRGPGANCSSIGSALDLLFLSAALAGVVMATVAAAFGGEEPAREDDGEGEEGDDASAR